MSQKAHAFELVTFNQPTWCALCSDFIWGIYHQGKKCKHCLAPVHKKCTDRYISETGPCSSVANVFIKKSEKKDGKLKQSNYEGPVQFSTNLVLQAQQLIDLKQKIDVSIRNAFLNRDLLKSKLETALKNYEIFLFVCHKTGKEAKTKLCPDIWVWHLWITHATLWQRYSSDMQKRFKKNLDFFFPLPRTDVVNGDPATLKLIKESEKKVKIDGSLNWLVDAAIKALNWYPHFTQKLGSWNLTEPDTKFLEHQLGVYEKTMIVFAKDPKFGMSTDESCLPITVDLIWQAHILSNCYMADTNDLLSYSPLYAPWVQETTTKKNEISQAMTDEFRKSFDLLANPRGIANNNNNNSPSPSPLHRSVPDEQLEKYRKEEKEKEEKERQEKEKQEKEKQEKENQEKEKQEKEKQEKEKQEKEKQEKEKQEKEKQEKEKQEKEKQEKERQEKERQEKTQTQNSELPPTYSTAIEITEVSPYLEQPLAKGLGPSNRTVDNYGALPAVALPKDQNNAPVVNTTTGNYMGLPVTAIQEAIKENNAPENGLQVSGLQIVTATPAWPIELISGRFFAFGIRPSIEVLDNRNMDLENFCIMSPNNSFTMDLFGIYYWNNMQQCILQLTSSLDPTPQELSEKVQEFATKFPPGTTLYFAPKA